MKGLVFFLLCPVFGRCQSYVTSTDTLFRKWVVTQEFATTNRADFKYSKEGTTLRDEVVFYVPRAEISAGISASAGILFSDHADPLFFIELAFVNGVSDDFVNSVVAEKAKVWITFNTESDSLSLGKSFQKDEGQVEYRGLDLKATLYRFRISRMQLEHLMIERQKSISIFYSTPVNLKKSAYSKGSQTIQSPELKAFQEFSTKILKLKIDKIAL
jgi:hypothetical protein